VFAAGGLNGWGDLSPRAQGKLASAHHRRWRIPQAQRCTPATQEFMPHPVQVQVSITGPSVTPVGLGKCGEPAQIHMEPRLQLLPRAIMSFVSDLLSHVF